MLNPASPLPLKDPTLFRQTNYIDGKWVEADGRLRPVKNSRAVASRSARGPRQGHR